MPWSVVLSLKKMNWLMGIWLPWPAGRDAADEFHLEGIEVREEVGAAAALRR
jgi:hypothetical protein